MPGTTGPATRRSPRPCLPPEAEASPSEAIAPSGLAEGGYRRPCGLPYNRRTLRREPFTEARLLTVNEVADLLRVSRMTVYRLIRQGDIAALRVGRNYRLREEDVQSYLNERYTEAG